MAEIKPMPMALLVHEGEGYVKRDRGEGATHGPWQHRGNRKNREVVGERTEKSRKQRNQKTEKTDRQTDRQTDTAKTDRERRAKTDRD